MDLRGIPMIGSWLQPSVILEQPEPNFTVGNSYSLLGIVVDATPTPPKPYIISVDDSGHFKLVDINKVRRG
jgi:hypothetical protein